MTFSIIAHVASRKRKSAAARSSIEEPGTVTAVNDKAHTFRCHWKNGEPTYKTSDKTLYWGGQTEGPGPI
jgi:hypothetical protein